MQLQTHLSRAQYLILMCSVVLAYVYLPIIATLQSIYDLVRTDWPNIGQMDSSQLGHTYGVRKYSQYAYLCHLWRGDNTPPVPTCNTVDEMLRMWEFHSRMYTEPQDKGKMKFTVSGIPCLAMYSKYADKAFPCLVVREVAEPGLAPCWT